MLISDYSELFLPQPIYLVALLITLCVAAFRSPPNCALHRWRWASLALALWSWAFSAPAVASLVLAQLEGPRNSTSRVQAASANRSDNGAVIVLSSGQLWGSDDLRQVRLDEHGWERLYEGVLLWRTVGGRLVFAGGPPARLTDSGDSMASLMSKIARDLGVPNDALATAAASTNTYEELVTAKSLLRDRSGPVWLVTSAVHMPRALAIVQRLGISVHPYPVDFRQLDGPSAWAWLPHNGGPRLFELALHELIGLAVYRLRGWAD